MAKLSLVQRRIGATFRRLRTEKGLSVRACANYLGTNVSKYARIENGENYKVEPGLIMGWAFKLGAPRSLIEELEAMAEETKNPGSTGWLKEYSTVPSWFSPFVALESEATSLDIYEGEYITGLLQTREYARAVDERNPLLGSEERQETLVVKVKRQEAVLCDLFPMIRVILNEACLRRIWQHDFFQGQIDHLVARNKHPNIEINVVPFDVGIHASMIGSYTIMGFEAPEDPEVVYVESHCASQHEAKRVVVSRYRKLFSDTKALAVPLEEYLNDPMAQVKP